MLRFLCDLVVNRITALETVCINCFTFVFVSSDRCIDCVYRVVDIIVVLIECEWSLESVRVDDNWLVAATFKLFVIVFT